QQTIDLRRGRPGKTVATHEAVLKTACSLAPAIEAGAVPRGQRRHLVQKEKFGPTGTARGAVSAHRLPPRSARVLQCADDPGSGRPASRKKRLRRWIMDDAAIAREETARR